MHSFRHELRYLQLEQGQKICVAYERIRRTDEIETLLERINNLNSASFKMAFEYIYLPVGQNKYLKWYHLEEQLAVYEIAERDKEGNVEDPELEDNGDDDELEDDGEKDEAEDNIFYNRFQAHVASFRHQLRYLQLEQGRKLYLSDERNGR